MHYANTYHTSRKRDNELMKATAFSLALLFISCLCLITAFVNSPPIILGTEMNTNGMVEYLCLGNGCENLRNMDW